MSLALLRMEYPVFEPMWQHCRTCPEPRAWLYYIQAGDDGPVKVGLAVNPYDRLSTLQQGNAVTLTLRSVEWTCKHAEKFLHEIYAPAHIRGEWFEPAPLVKSVMEQIGWMHAWELEELAGADMSERLAEIEAAAA